MAILIGIIAGFGAVILYELLIKGTHLFLTQGAGFSIPHPSSAGTVKWSPPKNPLLLIPIITLGGLFSGILVYRFAPEAEGHGTDAAIKAFHRGNGYIRRRVPLIKMISSVLTISSGGSAGREGPTAQIAAGFGSYIGEILHLNTHDRRIAVAVGVGAGIGTIFKAPLGGAILAIEILYKEDFEKEALIPAVIASVVGYNIFGYFEGFEPIFGAGFHYNWNIVQIPFFLILGAFCAIFGSIYVKTFYKTRDIFKGLNISNYLKPALGAFLVGLLAVTLIYLVPDYKGAAGLGGLSMGYGFIQLAIYNSIPIEVMLLLIIVKIAMTSLTIGSGGSGGVFAPGLVIGAMVGGLVGTLSHLLFPGIVPASSIPAFVVIGMMALFGAVSKAYIAVLLMVSEMTNEYQILFPAMVAIVGAGFFISKNTTIYSEQVTTRLDSPAHQDEYMCDLLKIATVGEAMIKKFPVLKPSDTLNTVVQKMEKSFKALPIVKDNKLIGCIRLKHIVKIPSDRWSKTTVDKVMWKSPVFVHPNDSIFDAFKKIESKDAEVAFVVDKKDRKKLIGILHKGDIIRYYLGGKE